MMDGFSVIPLSEKRVSWLKQNLGEGTKLKISEIYFFKQ